MADEAGAANVANVIYTGRIGHIEPFNDSEEDIETYIQRLDQYFLVNDVPDAKKAPALLSLVGAKVFKLLKNLVTPAAPSTKSYDDLCTTLKDHFKPKANRRTLTYRFRCRKQKEGESLKDFLANLKELSVDCEFGTDLQRQLCDGFIYGLRNEHSRTKLLAKTDVTLEQAFELASLLDQASADAKEISTPVAVHALAKQKYSRPSQKDGAQQQRRKCYRCGFKNHTAAECYFKESPCNSCGKIGHIPRVCMSKSDKDSRKQQKGRESRQRAKRKPRVHQLDETSSDASSETEVLSLEVNAMTNSHTDKITLTPKINGVKIPMELDTGSALSIITKSVYDKHFSDIKLKQSATLLKTFSGEIIKPLGTLRVTLKIHGNKRSDLILYVTDCGKNSLFGRDWLREVKLDWSEIKTLKLAENINSTTIDGRVKKLFDTHAQLFSPGIGKLKGYAAKFQLKPDAKPIFMKARVIPFSLRDKVKAELDRLQAAEIISPVKHSEYATPIVPVIKRNGTVRLCGDFKCTLNKLIEPEQYPLPCIDEIFASFAGGKKFSKIDLTEAYLAYEIAEEHRKYFTISTPWGLYQYNRMLYGITDAPGKWQRVMDTALQGIPYVKCILDDILVSGIDDEDHLRNLSAVMNALEQHGLKANLKKTELFRDHVDWCGHRISANGLEQNESKVKAIVDAPAPKNASELRTWIGMVTYYHKFLPDVASKLQPLYALLGKNAKWEWKTAHKQAFAITKEEIASSRVLTHYNPSMPLYLQCDASYVGLGAVLSHKFSDGSDRPILFISRSLRPAEKNYSQLDLEATAIFWATKKLIHYLYGRHFTLVTDNYPITRIFHAQKSIPQMSAMRLQRYAIFLSGLNYTIEFRSSKQHANADALSRLPLAADNNSINKPDTTDIIAVNMLQSLPVDHKAVRQHTQKDPVLSKVTQFVSTGDWNERDNEFATFYRKKDELSTHNNCLFWGHRVVIPKNLEDDILQALHETHAGISKTKSLARSYIWFPNIDERIETMIKNCHQCLHHIKTPPESPLISWPTPENPWERLHIDHAFYDNKILLCVIDAFSKYPHASVVGSTDSETTINKLQELFSMFGLPKVINCDNATSFSSEKFQNWCKSLGIQLKFSMPFSPKTNGLVEKFNSTLKCALKSMKNVKKSLQEKLLIILFRYRITPHSTTNTTPSQLMFGRVIRNKFSLLTASHNEIRSKKQERSRKNDQKMREFMPGERIAAKDYRQNSQKWQTGTITNRTGPLSYTIQTDEGAHWRRHADQLVNNAPQAPPTATKEPIDIDLPPVIQPRETQLREPQPQPRADEPRAQQAIAGSLALPQHQANAHTDGPALAPLETRRSKRSVKPVDHYGCVVSH